MDIMLREEKAERMIDSVLYITLLKWRHASVDLINHAPDRIA
jgi:hypothetical protein